MNLYEITGDYLTLLNMLTNPDEDEQVILDTLESVEYDFEQKADAYAKIRLELKGELEKVKTEIDRLTKIKKRLSNNIDRLTDNLKKSMELTGKEKFKTELFSYSIRQSPGKVVIDGTVPDEFNTVTVKPDLTSIKAYIKMAKEPIKWAHIDTSGTSLTIK